MRNSDKKLELLKEKAKGKPFLGFLFFVALLLAESVLNPLYAQKHDVGLGLGAANYTGDLVRHYSLRTHRPAGWAFYRYNVNNAVSLRGSVSLGRLAVGDDPEYDAFAARRNREIKTILGEVAATVEYNFLDYKDPKSLVRWSPYFFGGVALFMNKGISRGERSADFRSLQPSIPVGIGFKYRITPYLTLGYEWGARKTFFDYIDNTGELIRSETGGQKNYQYGNIHSKDWYYFTGFTLSYTFWNIPCPYYTY